MGEREKVSKAEFLDFIKNYPRKLDVDICGISDPPLKTYNDFTIADKWPESVVASTFKYPSNEEDRYYIPEEDREYYIYRGKCRNE